jgi:hypothetical protein
LISFRNQVSGFNDSGISHAPGQNEFNVGRLVANDLQQVFNGKQIIIGGDIYLIQDNHLILAGMNDGVDFLQAVPGQGTVFRGWIIEDKAIPSELLDDNMLGKIFQAVQFAVVHAFNKLADEDLQSGSGRPQCLPQGGCGFSLSIASVELNIASFHV